MSIKMKIPIIIAGMLILNTIILFLYYNFYFFDEVAKKLEKISGIRLSKEILKQNRTIISLLRFEAVTLFILVLLIGAAIYFMYSRPLVRLNESVKCYQENKLPLTRRKDEIGQLQNTFAQLSAELYEEKQTQNRIIASISHDIKTPLTSILGYSESLLKKELPQERVKQYLQVIYGKANDINDLVQEFDYYIEGKLTKELNRQNCRISYLEEMLLLEYQKELGSKGIVFTVDNQCKADETASVDLAKLRRVFANLIGNSIKHNRNQDKLQITVTIKNTEGRLTFCVADNGKGIRKEDMVHVFEPFYTSDSSRSVSGLGLSICESIIEAHQGVIWADNNYLSGFKIFFTL